MLKKSIIGLLVIIVILHLWGLNYFYFHPWFGYDNIFGYDKIIHFLSGVWLALFAYKQINPLIKTRTFLLFIILISFAVTIGVFWEFFEFSFDHTFHKWYNLPLAQASLNDTMFDLFWDFVGGLTISFYLWKKKLL